jgi:hypothetical protein
VRVLRLELSDCVLLDARYAQHGNSQRRMLEALREAGAGAAAERLRALRGLERRFGVDLGSLCHRFRRRDRPETHPIERFIVEHVTELRRGAGGRDELWVLLDHVRQVRELMEGRLVGKPEA